MPPTILLVDDSRSILKMLKDTFAGAGYQVITAHNGEMALECVIEQKIDMLITDYLMPEMNGITLTRTLRSMTDYKNIPILLLSTETEAEPMEAARQAGATGWAAKPFEPERLLKLTRQLLADSIPLP